MESIQKNLQSKTRGDVMRGLKSIQTILVTEPASTILTSIPLSYLFNSISQCASNDEFSMIVGIFEKILSIEAFPDFTKELIKNEDLQKVITEGMKEKNSRLREFIVGIMRRFTLSEELLRDILLKKLYNSFFKGVVLKALVDEDLIVVKKSHKLIVNNIFSNKNWLKYIFDKKVIGDFKNVLLKDNNEIHVLRYYELFLCISTLSSETFEFCVKAEVIDDFIKFFENCNNVLTLLNILELFKLIVETKEKQKRSELKKQYQKICLKKILEVYSEKYSSDELMSTYFLSIIGMLKDFVYDFEVEEEFLNKMVKCLDHSNKKIVQVAIEVLGIIIRDSEKVINKILVDDDFFRKYFDYFESSNPDMRSTQLYSLSTIFHSQKLSDELLEKFFFKKTDIVESLMKILSDYGNSLQEERIASYNLILSLSKFHWGIKAFLKHPLFESYILDRSTENEEKCLELKFLIIKKMSETMKYKYRDYDQKTLVEFMAYVKNGVHFVEKPNVKVNVNVNTQ